MAGKSDIEAGRAYVTLYVKNSALMKGLQQFQAQLKILASGLKQFGQEISRIGKSITFVGLAIGGALVAGISKVVAKTPELSGIATAFDESRKAVEQLFIQIATALGPSLIDIANRFTVFVKGLADFVATHKELIVDIAKALVVFTGIGIAIMAAGQAFSLVGAAISVANTLITVSTVIATTAVWALNAAFAFLASPIVLITGAVVGLAGAALYFAGAFTGTGDLIKESAVGMAATVMTAFGGIRDALLSGNLSAAAEIAWLGIRTVFQQGINLVMNVWDQFVLNLQNTWAKVTLFIQEALLGTAGFITRQIQKIIDAINLIPGLNLGSLEFDSRTSIAGARRRSVESSQERESRNIERKRDREALVTGLSRELAEAIDKVRKKTAVAPALPEGIVDPRQLRASDKKKMAEAAMDSRQFGAYGTFYAGRINQVLGIDTRSRLDKIASINQKMLKELMRIVFEFGI